MLTKSKLMVSQLKEPRKEEKPVKKVDDIDKLKARLTTLEKANEHSKNKLSTLEAELLSKDNQLKKYADDVQRLK